MFARKHMGLLAVFAALSSLGILLAEDPKATLPPKTEASPAPQMLPTQAAPKGDPSATEKPVSSPERNEPRSYSSEERDQQLKQLAGKLKAGEQQVMIDVMCVQVPAGFSEESGLTANEAKLKTPNLMTSLNPREVKLLEALLRATPGKHILARPNMVVLDGQTGFFEMGGPVENVPVLVASNTNGKTDFTTQTIRVISSYVTLRVTPRISKETGKIALEVNRQITQVNDDKGRDVQTPAAQPSFSVDTIRTPIELPSGGTVVLGNTIESSRDKASKSELLWVLTPHVIKGKQ
jgi:type II secretory pathway component GspD/PulD (secretin)